MVAESQVPDFKIAAVAKSQFFSLAVAPVRKARGGKSPAVEITGHRGLF